jgi:hypothetical protein
LSKISDLAWRRTLEETTEITFAENCWLVYEPHAYRLHGMEGVRYIEVAGRNSHYLWERADFIDPLSPEYANLFLKFARWFDSQKMEKAKPNSVGVPTFDTKRNAQAALAWVRK